MAAHVLTINIEVEIDDLPLFRAAVSRHAEVTREREDECTYFDVCFGAERRSLCLIYAIFESGDALDHHLASDHFNLFRELTASWVISRIDQVWELGFAPRYVGQS